MRTTVGAEPSIRGEGTSLGLGIGWGGATLEEG